MSDFKDYQRSRHLPVNRLASTPHALPGDDKDEREAVRRAARQHYLASLKPEKLSP